jgi:hypothetical protein
LKSLDKIKELPDKSRDIESDNMIKRYQRIPRQLEHLCLADFVAWFNCVKDKNATAPNTQPLVSDGFLPETDFEDNNDDDLCEDDDVISENEYQLKGGLKLVKRRKPQ